MSETMNSLPDLPIRAQLPVIAAQLESHTQVIIEAPPGAGKSTLLPLILLDAAWRQDNRQKKKILLLEPRRIAARAVAMRMAALLHENVGQRIGYRTRLESRVSGETIIEVITEGILTRMLQNDPALENIAVVIFDEFHERSLHADLGLALCLDTQALLREDLKIIIMSATLEGQALRELLPNSVTQVAEGKLFPVATHYLPPPKPLGGQLPPRIEAQVVSAIRRAAREETGDMLVFLPGTGEIRRVQENLQTDPLAGDAEIIPLYGDLDPAAQDRALQPSPSGARKIILSTSIAETSLTIDGVRIVIDSGLSRRARFDPASGMSRLETLPSSRAASDQRRGRAGRTQSGACYRLWPEAAHAQRAAHTPPEMLEADLCPLALELACWGNADPAQLRWLTPPPRASLQQAQDLLRQLGALDAANKITTHGRAMAVLGLHPRLAHMLLRAEPLGLTPLAANIAALLGERDILRHAGRASDKPADIHFRLDCLTHSTPASGSYDVDRGGLKRVKQSAAQILAWVKPDPRIKATLDADAAAGLLLSLAYPDRLARQREDDHGRFVLAQGRGAVLPAHDALAKSEFLAVAALDAGSGEARIQLAAALKPEILQAHYRDEIKETSQTRWDSQQQAVISEQQRTLFGLVLEKSAQRPSAAAALDAMLTGIRELGLSVLPWDETTRNWQARVWLLKASGHPLAGGLPSADDTTLTNTLEQWLAPHLTGITRREQLSKVDLSAALASLLTWVQQQTLDKLLPTHLTVPSGSRVRIDYTPASGCVLEVRLQEVFGWRATPALADGRVALTLHLLSPARRPVQVTRDLASFWKTGYFEVKKELRGRYPKHYWPDDPLIAEPTARARPRPRK